MPVNPVKVGRPSVRAHAVPAQKGLRTLAQNKKGRVAFEKLK